MVGAIRLALRSSAGNAARSRTFASVKTAATRTPALSTSTCRFTPSIFLAPSNPATGDVLTRRWSPPPLPSVGGTEPERLEEVRQYAPEAFRGQERAVTEDDYAAAAQRQHQRGAEHHRPGDDVSRVDGRVLTRPDDKCAERNLHRDQEQ